MQPKTRLRESVKRLVIELGYLENCLAQGYQDPHLHTAATSLDTAIDALNCHLEYGASSPTGADANAIAS